MRNLKDYIKNYSSQPFEDIQAAYRQKKVLELIKKQRHRYILEVGCGLDPFYNYFNDFEQLVIVEPASGFYEKAASVVIKNEELISRVIIINDYLENAIDRLHIYEFDYIIISSLLHEIENIEVFFEKLKVIVKKDTIVHIDVPNARSFHRVLAFEMGLIDSLFEISASNVALQQQIVYDLDSISKLIVRYGFKLVNSGTYFIKPFTHKQMAGLLEHKIIDHKVLEGLFRMSEQIPDLGSELFVEFKTND